MAEQNLTILQLSKLLDASRQTVYRALNTPELQQYIRHEKKGNSTVTVVSSDALPMLRAKLGKIDLSQFAAPAPEQPTTGDKAANPDITASDYEALQKAIEALTAQLAVKDEQLAAKDKQIEALTSAVTQTAQALTAAQASLRTEQQLHAGTIQHGLLTDAAASPVADPDEPAPEEQPKAAAQARRKSLSELLGEYAQIGHNLFRKK